MTMASAATLQCPLCSQPNFVSIDSLRSSLINVTNRPLICPICNEIQMGLDKLTIHLLSHSMKSSTAAFVDTCATVGPSAIQTNAIVVPSSSANASSTTVDSAPKSSQCVATNAFAGEVPDCQFCGSTFRTAELRRMHMQLVHELFVDKPTNGNDTAYFQCNECPKHFKMEGSLHLHCRMVHGRLAASVRRMEKRLPMAQRQTKSNSPRVHDDLSLNGNHDAEDSNGSRECPTTGSGVSNGDEKTFDCTTCGKSFTTKYFLKKHKRLHTGEMPYVCEICNRTFTFQQSYHRHLSYHTADRPHKCSVCGRAFKELSTLHNHERIHSGEKPFQCETCEKCFRQRISYLVHRRIHTGVLPYDCKTCDKKFRYKISLRTHKCTGAVTAPTEIQAVSVPSAPPAVPPNDIESMPVVDDLLNLDCSRALDEFVTESYNRMGIVDATETGTVGNHSDAPLMANNFFNYNITADNDSHFGEVQRPFEHHPPSTTRLPSMQELLAPSSQQQSSIDAINELFLCHSEY